MQYYLSLGANLGERERTITQALQMIEQQIGTVLRCSSFYYSPAWGFESENEFCNLCSCVETSMQPLEVLLATQVIEQNLGRTLKSLNGYYSDRYIDIDIILAFDEHNQELFINTPELTIPHPLWSKRDFVKVPLAEIL